MIYYLKHLLQDMDEEKMLSRALISYFVAPALSKMYVDVDSSWISLDFNRFGGMLALFSPRFRACWRGYITFNHPQTVMHPILTFSLDLLWDRLAARQSGIFQRS